MVKKHFQSLIDPFPMRKSQVEKTSFCLIGLTLNILEIKRIKIANLLPVLILAPLISVDLVSLSAAPGSMADLRPR
jgi:uncharacterized membrane protein YqgA involved in biofilm formation